jgi:hypothetical protein
MPTTVRAKPKQAGSSAALAGKRRALLICNGRFQTLRLELPGVASDAKQLSEVLGDPNRGGFEVECLLDKGLLDVRMAIARACSASEEQDTLLLYYSGASLKGDDGNLQLPVFGSVDDQLTATCVESEFVLSRMRHSKIT